MFGGGRNTRRRFLCKEAKDFKKIVKDEVEKIMTPELQKNFSDPMNLYVFKMTLFTNTYYKNGRIRQLDASNFIKNAEDSLCEALGTDDKNHFDVIASKVDAPKNRTKLELFRIVED